MDGIWDRVTRSNATRSPPSPDGDPDIGVQRSAKHRICRVYVFHNGAPPPTLRPSSFTVNWKSNPLTNSWTDGGGGGKRVFSHETTILPWYRLAISYRCCDESFTFRRGKRKEIPEFLHDGAKANIQEFTVVSLIPMCFVSTKIRSWRKKNETEERWNVVFVIVLLTIRDNVIGKCLFSRPNSGSLRSWIHRNGCNFRMRRVSYKGNESREREKREGVSIGDLNHNLTC